MGTGAGEAEAWTSIAGHIEASASRRSRTLHSGHRSAGHGNGDWNDTSQPAHLSLREWMVSSWTAALLFQQVSRYAGVLRRAGSGGEAERLSKLADAIREDFNRYLIRDGVVAGYAHFDVEGSEPDLLLHPSDCKTGVRYSLHPDDMRDCRRPFHAGAVKTSPGAHPRALTFPDGVRLMDKPLPYHGGSERIFRRAESSPCFGREVGLMYVQAHLRYCEALAILGNTDSAWAELQKVSPIAVTDAVANAALRQRNCYFTSSDAAFHDRYEASAEWERVKAGAVAVEGGWRVYRAVQVCLSTSSPGGWAAADVERFGAQSCEHLQTVKIGFVS